MRDAAGYDPRVTSGFASRFVPILLAAGLLAGCGSPKGLLVFGAASLADALEAAGSAWKAEHPQTPVEFHFAGSNDLARQIAAGAPADLFVAADRKRLDEAERVDPAAAVRLLGNELVVIAPRDPVGTGGRRVASARDLLAFERLGLADPEAVPAGVYAREWLEGQGVWGQLHDRVVPALDVRANLAAVASGSVPVGVVYATDAVAGDLGKRVTVLYRVPEAEAPPVVYWAAPVVGGPAAAGRFLEFLEGPEAGAIFRRYGFRHLPTESEPPGG